MNINQRIALAKRSLKGISIGDAFGESFFGEQDKMLQHIQQRIIPETTWEFTDDTVMTLAVAKWLTIDPEHTHEKLVECMKELGRKYMFVGYGKKFLRWIISRKTEPYKKNRNIRRKNRYNTDEDYRTKSLLRGRV